MIVRTTLSALLLAFLCFAPLAAEEPLILGQRISLDLKGAPAEQVFKSFATILEADLEMDAAVEKRLEVLTFTNVTVRTGLNAACESLGCHWKATDEPRLLKVWWASGGEEKSASQSSIGLGHPVSIDLKAARAEMIWRSLAATMKADLDLDPALFDDQVSIRLDNKPLKDGLDALCEMQSCHWEWFQGEPPLLRVTQILD